MLNLHLRLTLPALVILLSGMSQIATADEQLQTLVSKVCDFQIDIPANPDHQTSDPNSNLVKHTFTFAKRGVSLYQVFYNPDQVTDNTPDTAEKWKKEGAKYTKDLETAQGVKIKSSKVVNHNGMVGFEIAYDFAEAPDVSSRIRFFNVIGEDRKSRLYTIVVAGPSDFMKSENVKQFFASFKIVSAEKSPRAELKTLVSKVCAFQIDMPANPDQQSSDPNSKLVTHSFISVKPGASLYQVGYDPDRVSDNMPDTAEKWEELSRQVTKDFETGMGATTTSGRVIQYQGMDGYETSFDLRAVPGFSGRLRLFQVAGTDRESRLYVIMAVGPAEFMKSESVSKFFASFKILPAE